MALLSTLRQKKRYIVFEVVGSVGSAVFRLEDVTSAVISSLHDFLGILGMSRSGVIFVKERFHPPFFVLRCTHTMVDDVKSGVILIKKIKNNPVIIRSVLVTGALSHVSSMAPRVNKSSKK